MISGNITLTGDVIDFEKFLTASFTIPNLESEIKKATQDNAIFLVAKIKEQILGRRFTKNSPVTLALSRGDIPLLKEKNLVDAIGFTLKSTFEAEVGVTRGRRSTGGVGQNSKPHDMEKVALLIHEGYTIDVTEAMRRAIAIALRKNPKKKRLANSSLNSMSGGNAKSVWRVPPRKFLTTTFKNQAILERVKRRWREAIEKAFLASGAKGGDHKDKGL